MKTVIKFLSVITLIFSSATFAHVKLQSSVPADNAMLATSPQVLTLSFSKKVRLVKVLLTNNQEEQVNFGFKPTQEASKEFSWQIPLLSPATYNVEMIFLGGDGHKMKDSFSFMVH